MAELTNLSFETPTYIRGEAAFWDEIYPNGASQICGFSYLSYYLPFENFEYSWSNNHLYQDYFATGDLVWAIFDELDIYVGYDGYSITQKKGVETFEWSWIEPNTGWPPDATNAQSLFTYFPTQEALSLASFNTATDEFEDFESDYDSNETSVADLASGTVSYANFDSGSPEAVEDFEEEWQDNEDYETAFSDAGGSAVKSAAMFNVGADAYEDFEGTWTETFV